ncbi:MAG: hypothetical protein EXQ83_13430 [Xanthobacteraceae bacterium]|nr:hypothetical protein [Xanthobacteraceae bacterium]
MGNCANPISHVPHRVMGPTSRSGEGTRQPQCGRINCPGIRRAAGADCADADLVLYFGLRSALACGARYRELRAMFAKAHIVGCSTGGQIRNDDVDDDIAAVALRFDRTRLRLAAEAIPTPEHSRSCGEAIGSALAADDLAGVVGAKIPLTGGLAGDSAIFQETLVGADCAPQSRRVAAIGFYGPAIRIGHGSAGG